MRILNFMSPPEGHEASSVALNEEEGVLDIFHPGDGRLIKESTLAPEILILRCRLRGVLRAPLDIRVQLTSEGETLESVLLYDEGSVAPGYDTVVASQWQGVALEYTGVGSVLAEGEVIPFQGTDINGGVITLASPLYVKPFRVETHFIEEQQKTLPSGEKVTTPLGGGKRRVLRGYGGYFKEGLPLKDIQQIYYSLTSRHHQTCVRLYRSTQLQEEGADMAFVSPLREEEPLSLEEALNKGHARFQCERGSTATLYASFQCGPLSGPFINVYFKSSKEAL